MIRAGTTLMAAAMALSLAACGSSAKSSVSSPPAASPTTAKSSTIVRTTPSPAVSTTSPSAAFCKGLQPHGEGPGDAFTVISTYSPSEASKAAKDQLALIAGVPTPPQEIAADWSAWRSYLSLVLKDAAKPGADASLASTLNAPTTQIEPARKKLEDYAFAHCK